MISKKILSSGRFTFKSSEYENEAKEYYTNYSEENIEMIKFQIQNKEKINLYYVGNVIAYEFRNPEIKVPLKYSELLITNAQIYFFVKNDIQENVRFFLENFIPRPSRFYLKLAYSFCKRYRTAIFNFPQNCPYCTVNPSVFVISALLNKFLPFSEAIIAAAFSRNDIVLKYLNSDDASHDKKDLLILFYVAAYYVNEEIVGNIFQRGLEIDGDMLYFFSETLYPSNPAIFDFFVKCRINLNYPNNANKGIYLYPYYHSLLQQVLANHDYQLFDTIIKQGNFPRRDLGEVYNIVEMAIGNKFEINVLFSKLKEAQPNFYVDISKFWYAVIRRKDFDIFYSLGNFGSLPRATIYLLLESKEIPNGFIVSYLRRFRKEFNTNANFISHLILRNSTQIVTEILDLNIFYGLNECNQNTPFLSLASYDHFCTFRLWYDKKYIIPREDFRIVQEAIDTGNLQILQYLWEVGVEFKNWSLIKSKFSKEVVIRMNCFCDVYSDFDSDFEKSPENVILLIENGFI